MIAICPEFSSNSLFSKNPKPKPFPPVSFIDSDEFDWLTPEMLAEQSSEAFFRTGESEISSGTNEEVAAGQLLTAAGERHFFRRYNYFKSLVARSQTNCRGIDTRRSSPATTVEIENWMRLAEKARTVLVEANVRLVASLARKYANSGIDIEELVSDGNLILVNAIEKFDYTRGFRFSTYATHAVQRHFFRMVKRKRLRNEREVTTSPEILAESHTDSPAEAPLDTRLADWLIQRFDDCLTPRERVILTGRFGLKGKPEATLKALADQIGLSKERVRQLQVSAIEKLRDLLSKSNINLLDSAENCDYLDLSA